MPGKRITQRQEALYMSERNAGKTQMCAAAKADISERSGRRVEQGKRSAQKPRHWRTRPDPLASVWSSECVPLLEANPRLLPQTLLEVLQDRHGGKAYPDRLLRTMQRRVKEWKALHGPAQDVVFRQIHEPGQQGLSDFTELKGITITIQQQPFSHLLYHFRLAHSGWSNVMVVQGGESYAALAEGLQKALWRLGGAPLEHRSDRLSAAFHHLSPKACEDLTQRYEQFCQHYGMQPTRNQRGQGHENGSVESPHGHIKRRIEQALMIRGHSNFDSVEAYQAWLDEGVDRHNERHAQKCDRERRYLQPLPSHRAVDFVELCARVSSSATIDVRRATYTVPSRLKGERLRVHLYDDRLECYAGNSWAITLARVYPIGATHRARNVNYRHVIDSLVKKPQAFRRSRLRDDFLPNQRYQRIWHQIDRQLSPQAACQWMVKLLHLAAHKDCELALADELEPQLKAGMVPPIAELQDRFGEPSGSLPELSVVQHALADYDDLCT